ncbi:diheme cytochrome c-553 [Aequorivita flava]|uniref:Diheme cytochrome c-553 n=1 Tax=Aequorivita flava TaxID=3114371 RepID=A0AB35YU70_9FLAO
MKNQFLSLALICMLTACDKKKDEAEPKLYEAQETEIVESAIKRGELLISAVGCHDCHSPKKMTDRGPILHPDLLLSGHPADEAIPNYDLETAKNFVLFTPGLTASVGPWGTSFAANITPDDTGIGGWTEKEFLTSIKHGKYKGMENGRNLLPPMPWQTISQLPESDLKAMFAYLQTIKPVKNLVPPPIPPKK